MASDVSKLLFSVSAINVQNLRTSIALATAVYAMEFLACPKYPLHSRAIYDLFTAYGTLFK